jgi:hypothetical protein
MFSETEARKNNWDWFQENYRTLLSGHEGQWVVVLEPNRVQFFQNPSEARRLVEKERKEWSAIVWHLSSVVRI